MRGSLPQVHGILVLLKDTIATRGATNTTAGRAAGAAAVRDAVMAERNDIERGGGATMVLVGRGEGRRWRWSGRGEGRRCWSGKVEEGRRLEV